jgi:hypothetical protein
LLSNLHKSFIGSFKNNIKLIKNIYISENNLHNFFNFILELMCFILINSCIIFQIKNLKFSFSKI